MASNTSKHHVWLTYSEYRHGGAAIDPEYEWTCYEDAYIDFSLKDCYNTSDKTPKWVKERVEVSFEPKVGQEVYVVVVRYTTGGTFGRTRGAWCIEGVFEHQDQADKLVKAIDKGQYEGYKPWVGHFESLESVDYKRMIVY